LKVRYNCDGNYESSIWINHRDVKVSSPEALAEYQENNPIFHIETNDIVTLKSGKQVRSAGLSANDCSWFYDQDDKEHQKSDVFTVSK
jgi:hypothetical protein